MWNGHLYKYEFDVQQKMLKIKYSVAKAMSHTFRYIDDIMPLNDKCLFESYRYQIYPEELELNRENVGYNTASVLEMQVDIIEGKFRVNVYDKRDHFNFKVFRFPSINSNVPDKTLYNVFYSQLVRFYRVCNNLDGFISAVKLLKSRVQEKGAKNKLLLNSFNRFWVHYDVSYVKKNKVIKNVF